MPGSEFIILNMAKRTDISKILIIGSEPTAVSPRLSFRAKRGICF